MPDDSITGNATGGGFDAFGTRRLPAGAVSPRVAVWRSRIGLWVPALGVPVLLAASALLVAFAHAPPGIGVIAFFCLLAQAAALNGPSRAKSRRRPASLDSGQLLLTGRSWTGTRTVDLTKLARVRRVKWTFSDEDGRSRTVDYVICADSTGARLALPRAAAVEPVQQAVAYQRQHHLPAARISRFAAIGLWLADDSLQFRMIRAAVLIAGVAGYAALTCWLVVTAIPWLAAGH